MSNVLVILRSALKYCKVIFVLSAISFLEIDRTHFQRLVRGGMLIFYCRGSCVKNVRSHKKHASGTKYILAFNLSALFFLNTPKPLDELFVQTSKGDNLSLH